MGSNCRFLFFLARSFCQSLHSPKWEDPVSSSFLTIYFFPLFLWRAALHKSFIFIWRILLIQFWPYFCGIISLLYFHTIFFWTGFILFTIFSALLSFYFIYTNLMRIYVVFLYWPHFYFVRYGAHFFHPPPHFTHSLCCSDSTHLLNFNIPPLSLCDV